MQEGHCRQCGVGHSSGAGKFTEKAKTAGPDLTARVVKLHVNWEYPFLRPTNEELAMRYKQEVATLHSHQASCRRQGAGDLGRQVVSASAHCRKHQRCGRR